MQEILISYLILMLISLLPPFVYIGLLRYLGKYKKESRLEIVATMFWGASFGITISLFIEASLKIQSLIYLFIAVAFIEEFIKPLGILFTKIGTPKSGVLYGASCGLGFAITENMLYGWFANLSGNTETLILTVFLRSISTTLLHGIATAITGYGIASFLIRKTNFATIIPFYLVAVFIHAIFNLAVC